MTSVVRPPGARVLAIQLRRLGDLVLAEPAFRSLKAGVPGSRLTVLTEQMRTEQSLMVRLAESQVEIKPILAKLAEAMGKNEFGIDSATKVHIRNLDIFMARLVEETAAGRNQLVQELRNEIRLLARTIAALAEEER